MLPFLVAMTVFQPNTGTSQSTVLRALNQHPVGFDSRRHGCFVARVRSLIAIVIDNSPSARDNNDTQAAKSGVWRNS